MIRIHQLNKLSNLRIRFMVQKVNIKIVKIKMDDDKESLIYVQTTPQLLFFRELQ